MIYAKKNKEVATFHLQGVVGEEFNGNWIAQDIAYINENLSEEIKEIRLRINSEGGNVINGMSAVSAIMNSEIPVKTYNDGYAMSMAGIIWLAAKKENRYSAEFALLMLHAPYLVADEGQVEPEDQDELNFLKAVKKQLGDIIKATTDKNDSDINEIFSKDSFYNTSEMISNGFINPDNIIRFQNKPRLGADHKQNIKTIAAFYNTNNNNTNMEFEKFFENLSLFNKATENKKEVQNYGELETKYNAVVEDKKELTARAEKAEAEVTELNAKLEGFKTLQAELEKKDATNKVEALVKDGRIVADKKDEMIEIAIKSPKMFDTIVANLVTEVKAPELPEITANRSDVAKELGIEVLNFHEIYKAGKMETLQNKYPSLYKELLKEEGVE